MGAVLICSFAFIIRIWERPYFELLFDPPYYDFKYFGSAVWYVIISMTSVGYGDIVATTHMGRGFAIAAIINGAFLLALLVGLISSWFKLDDTKQTTIKNIEMQNLAI